MGKIITIQCGNCPTTIATDEARYQQLAGQTIRCPICAAGIAISRPETSTPFQAVLTGDTARIQCPACGAFLTMVHEAYQKLVGTTINCLKCNTAIQIPNAIASAPAQAPSPASGSGSAPTAAPPTPASRTASAPAGAKQAGPKKCFTCGKEIAGGDVLCASCRAKQQADRVMMQVPAEARHTGHTVKLKLRGSAPAVTGNCVRCGAAFDSDAPFCPACGTRRPAAEQEQTSGPPVGWRRHVPRHALRGVHNKFLQFILRLLILGAIVLLAYWIYLFILSQLHT